MARVMNSLSKMRQLEGATHLPDALSIFTARANGHGSVFAKRRSELLI
jgi:hypothetical protein